MSWFGDRTPPSRPEARLEATWGDEHVPALSSCDAGVQTGLLQGTCHGEAWTGPPREQAVSITIVTEPRTVSASLWASAGACGVDDEARKEERTGVSGSRWPRPSSARRVWGIPVDRHQASWELCAHNTPEPRPCWLSPVGMGTRANQKYESFKGLLPQSRDGSGSGPSRTR